METRLPICSPRALQKAAYHCTIRRAHIDESREDVRPILQKVSIAVGCDADLVIWDAEREVTISQELLHHATDYTPWEGFKVTGWPLKTIFRGQLVFDSGKIIGQRGDGKFLARSLSLSQFQGGVINQMRQHREILPSAKPNKR